MGSNNTSTKTPSAFNPGYRRPTAAVVGTIEAPRGHGIGPSHTAQMTALNNKVQYEKNVYGALEGHLLLQEKENEYLCLKISRLDRQLQRTRQERDILVLRQYASQQEIQVEQAEKQLYDNHGIEPLNVLSGSREKRRIIEVDTPDTGRSPSPPKAPRRPANKKDKFGCASDASKSSEEPSSSASEKTSHPDMVDLSDSTDDEL